jgi:calcium/calmodulin-dependent protein kinase I
VTDIKGGMAWLMPCFGRGLVHFVEWFQGRHSYYIVYEVARGGELFDRLAAVSHFSEPDAKKAMRAILASLSA